MLARVCSQSGPRFLDMGVQAGQRNRRLARVLGSAPDRGHPPRPAGDRLAPRLGMGQPHEQASPVVGQPRHGQPTGRFVVREAL